MQVQTNNPSQQGPSAGPAFTAHAAAEFEARSYELHKCSVQVQSN